MDAARQAVASKAATIVSEPVSPAELGGVLRRARGRVHLNTIFILATMFPDYLDYTKTLIFN